MTDIILTKFGDHGSESSRRDKFQEEFAMYLCMEMLFDSDIELVICEYGEDIVLKRQNSFELYQVKTKQESVGAWTLENLLPIIAKTFAIAAYLDPVSKCHFVSNEGATGILHQLKSLLDTPSDRWSADQCSYFFEFCQKNSKKILDIISGIDSGHAYDAAQIEQRLKSLSIQTNFHHMDYLQDTILRRLRCYIEEKGVRSLSSVYVLTDSELWEIYEKITIIVGNATIGRTKREKSISRSDIESCIKLPPHQQFMLRIPTPEEIEQVGGRTRLERKLYLGGFSSLLIETSRDIMVNVMSETRQWEFGQAEELVEDMRMRVRHVCADCYDKTIKQYPSQEQIGREIIEDVRKHFPSLVNYYQSRKFKFVDETFLEGIAYWLTSECLLYWSQSFRQ